MTRWGNCWRGILENEALCEKKEQEAMMKISAPMEETGFFWLPDEDNKRVPGILRISESGKTTLEITTQFHPTLPSSLDNPRLDDNYVNFKRIVGVTENNYVTLENCSVIKSNLNLGSNLAKRIIRGGRAFMGVGYGKDSEITFSTAVFSVEGLDEWLHIRGNTVDYGLQDNQIQNISIFYSPPEAIVIQLSGEGMKLSFGFGFTIPFGLEIKETKITQSAYVKLESEELRSLDDFLEVIIRLHRFLCFAIGKIVPITSITGYSREITQEAGQNEKEREIPIKIFYKGMPIPNTNLKLEHHNMFFTYRDVKGQLDTTINKWLTNYKEFKPVFNLFFAFQFEAYLYLDGQFLSLAQSIEALHRMRYGGLTMPKSKFKARVKSIIDNIPDDTDKVWLKEKLRFANELTLRQRLEKMFEPFLDIYGKEKVPDLVSKIVEVRNLLTHAGSRIENIGFIKLHVLCGKLDTLLQLHFLHMIGMDSAFIAKLVKNKPAFGGRITRSEEDYRISSE